MRGHHVQFSEDVHGKPLSSPMKPSTVIRGSLYTGAAGVAYLLLDLASSGLESDARAASEEALRRLEEAEAMCDARRVTLLEGPAGCVALKPGSMLIM